MSEVTIRKVFLANDPNSEFMESIIEHNKLGQKHGKEILYYRNGYFADKNERKRIESYYVDNIKHGLETKYDQFGKIYKTLNYIDGKREGIEKTYAGGVLIKEVSYKDDKEIKIININGHKTIECEYYSNRNIKFEKVRGNSGTGLTYENNYNKSGKLHGNKKVINHDGSNKYSLWFFHGDHVENEEEFKKLILIEKLAGLK